MLSAGSWSGKRQPGSKTIHSIFRAPNFSSARKDLLPLNHTSTGYVTIAVTLSIIFAFGMGRIAGPVGANRTLSTTGEGICPASRTVTVVVPPDVVTLSIDGSTDSVVNNQ